MIDEATPINLCSVDDILEHLKTRYECVIIITDGGLGSNDDGMGVYIPDGCRWTYALGCIEWARDKCKISLEVATRNQLEDDDD